MNRSELETLAMQLIGDLTSFLLLGEKRRDQQGIGHHADSPVNRMAWNSLSVESARAIRYISAKTGVPLRPRTSKLLLDSLQAAYRQSKSHKSDGFGCQPPTQPSVIVAYGSSSILAGWLHEAVRAAVATIDEALAQQEVTQ